MRRAIRRTAGRAVLMAVLSAGVLSATAGTSNATAAELPPPAESPAEVRQHADDVLSRREFQRPEPSLIDKVQTWLQERLNRVLSDLVSGNGASVLGWLILFAALAAIVFFVVRFSRTVQADPHRSAGISVERGRTVQDWEQEAERHEGEEEWKLALRCRFRALVAALVTHGLVDDVPGRTAGEYRGELARVLPDAAHAFAEATELFEAAWYGNQDTGPTENERFRSLSDEVRQVAQRGTKRARAEAELAEAVAP